MDVAVIGGGLFGLSVALKYANLNHVVHVFEAQEEFVHGASRVNQARLHTGLHYPRDLPTAQTALETYQRFIKDFPNCVQEIKQSYAVSQLESLTSGHQFVGFAEELGIPFREVDVALNFDPNLVEIALEVTEGSFDYIVLKKELLRKCHGFSKITLHANVSITAISETAEEVEITSSAGSQYKFDAAVVCTYAHNKKYAEQLSVTLPVYRYQLCEILLGQCSLNDVGITIMDGPFWSTMPYGFSGLYSLTHVKYTPLLESYDDLLTCQLEHRSCGIESTFDCNRCYLRPISNANQMILDFRKFTGNKHKFEPFKSIYTLKAVPDNSITDARPTTVSTTAMGKVALIFSGKVGDILNLHHLPLI